MTDKYPDKLAGDLKRLMDMTEQKPAPVQTSPAPDDLIVDLHRLKHWLWENFMEAKAHTVVKAIAEVGAVRELRAEVDRWKNDESRAAGAVEHYQERASAAEAERDALAEVLSDMEERLATAAALLETICGNQHPEVTAFLASLKDSPEPKP